MQRGDYMRKFIRSVFFVLLVTIVGAGIWLYTVYYEGEKPEIVLSSEIKTIGLKTVFEINCTDKKSGIRSASVAISQDGKKTSLAAVTVPARGKMTEVISIDLRPMDIRLHDGDATVEISVTDFSLRKNTGTINLSVTIDTIPPQISPITAYNYINPGGTCVVAYTLSEVVSKSVVVVDKDLFPSYPESKDGNNIYIAYFAIPIIDSEKENIRIHILAEDSAGNSSVYPIPFKIMGKKFRSDRMNISQQFLEMKMPEFQNRYRELQGTTLLDAFCYINDTMRQQDRETIETICKNTKPEKLWDGAFLRMTNASTMATFGDKRTYYNEGTAISKSVHMGVDLASTRTAEVEASNSGVIAFTGYIGIYGNTVIIDHGMGIFSLYGHLSSIGVSKDQTVSKGEIIGRTGLSGMAGGDHLHFSIIVGGKFVNPVEWWDPHWIRDNITRKLSGEI